MRPSLEDRVPVTNLLEAVLDREKLKWDAIWHLMEWLLDPKEGHTLGTAITEQLCVHAFGQFADCEMKREYQLSPVKDGKGKWPDFAIAIPSFENPKYVGVMDDVDLRSPGGRRKLDNLKEYRSLTLQMFPDAIVRVVVLTNAKDEQSIRPLYGENALRAEAVDFTSREGWRLLPLQTVGEWVSAALASQASPPPEKMKLFLLDLVEWTKSLDSKNTKVVAAGK
jgi:hypothetical protein